MLNFNDGRRRFLITTGLSLGACIAHNRAWAAELPFESPLAALKLEWTNQLKWVNVVDVTHLPGEGIEEKLTAAQSLLSVKGGGVAYFPAGTYSFKDSIKLLDGIVLRGVDPSPVKSAQNDNYGLLTKFEFPKYEFAPEGDGTPILKAFKGIYLADPAGASNVGVVNIDINRGHIHLNDDGTEAHKAGRNRIVFGCVLRNAAGADASIPNLKLNQKGWQRFTARHHAAIDVCADANLLIANNRLPKSGDDNFMMNGYVIQDTKKKETTIDGIVFDYDNRPGMYVNHYNIGGPGGQGPDGTPETHPHGFRKGIVIRDNYIFNTGRLGIGFCGDGVQCLNNMIRIPDDIWRPTVTGTILTTGSATNDNRAVEMRGWRWLVDGNDFQVHRNWAFEKKHKINDGEGLMHEDHANSTIKDSILTNNRGNTYLSLYKTAGIDGLHIEGNDIRLGDGRQVSANSIAIFVSADRTKERFPIKGVSIIKNTVAVGGILISGDPSEKNEVKGNKNAGVGTVPLILKADAGVADNTGFEIKK